MARAKPPFEAASAGAPQRQRKIKAAMAWLKVELVAGPRPASELEALARAQGIPKSTLTLARQRCHITSQRVQNRWIWTMPAKKPVKS